MHTHTIDAHQHTYMYTSTIGNVWKRERGGVRGCEGCESVRDCVREGEKGCERECSRVWEGMRGRRVSEGGREGVSERVLSSYSFT